MTMIRSEKLLRLAKGQRCVMCMADDDTIVAAHSNLQEHGKGMGLKAHDCMSAWLCYSCHRDYDTGFLMSKEEKREYILTAICRTNIEMWRQGLLGLK
jgi:uncharacterized CHY-type Zn-finger protein